MPDPLMPSLPQRDGVDAPLCACIGVGASTVSPADTINSVDGTSLPLPPTGEHNAVSVLSRPMDMLTGNLTRGFLMRGNMLVG